LKPIHGNGFHPCLHILQSGRHVVVGHVATPASSAFFAACRSASATLSPAGSVQFLAASRLSVAYRSDFMRGIPQLLGAQQIEIRGPDDRR
jgi:hypothetical protein